MAPTFDGSSPAAVFGAAAATTALTTASFTPPSGSIIVAKSLTADNNTIPAAPTGTGLTFTSRLSTNGGATSTGFHTIYTAVGAGTATTVTATYSGTANYRALIVEVWTAAQLAATPATNFTARTTLSTAPSATITTTGTGSVVSWSDVDYAGTTGTATYRSSAVQIAALIGGGVGDNYYVAYQAAAVAGAQTYGMTAPTQNWSLSAIEIQASGAVAATPFRRIGKRSW